MTEPTDEAIGEVLTGMLQRVNEELYQMTEDEVRARWYFTYDPAQSVPWNMLEFHEMLRLYASSCRRWEEKHHGSQGVVGRVKVKYLMPRILDFAAELRAQIKENEAI